jgi:hypothetical protein
MMRFERYRRMQVVGRVFVAIGLSMPMLLIVLLWLHMYSVVQLIGLGDFVVVATVFIVIGVLLWVGGWVLEGN